MKKFYIRTYGCQMNDYDSVKLTSMLEIHGYKKTDVPEDADYIIANTCSVRKNAEDRAFAFLSSQKPLKQQGKIICLFGCIANLYGDQIFKRYKFIDIVCGPNNYNNIPEIFNIGKKGCFIGENQQPFIDALSLTDKTIAGNITVTKGCENFCSYCVVPFTRGKLISKCPETICREIKHMVERGTREITLLGQNVNEYGKDIGTNFIELLEKVHSIDGLLRIGFTTSHPKDIPDELIALFKKLPKLYKHLHLPIQSGSDKILKLMNRKYTIEKYEEIIKKVRETVPEITITSDIIAGYPGEEEKDFQQTCKVIESIEFDDLFVFKYSPRPGTAAAMCIDSVPIQEKERRHNLILDIQNNIAYKKNRVYLGKKMPVFLRNASNKRQGFLVGRTITNKPVLLKLNRDNLGKIRWTEITKAYRRYLVGQPFDENE